MSKKVSVQAKTKGDQRKRLGMPNCYAFWYAYHHINTPNKHLSTHHCYACYPAISLYIYIVKGSQRCIGMLLFWYAFSKQHNNWYPG